MTNTNLDTNPFFSIICPTIQRESLVRCCRSVVNQSFSSCEMIVQVDAERIDEKLFDRIHPTRKIWVEECGEHHNNFGNTCRHLAWKRATGNWVLYLDCDNYLADEHVLGDLAVILSTVPHWAIFPILRFGHYFLWDPPGVCRVDTSNMLIRREIAQWPSGPEYTMDGIFCEQLKTRYPYVAFPDMRPIVVMEKAGLGQ